ncbi:MAG: SRPBCC domain-containing protein [Actinobacteria bacterium]|nr:SRPBCC domain-containing protein [Actinomycetota bacterium]
MSTMEALPPIRKSITVDAPVATAFETFTRGMGSWWPAGSHSIHEGRVEEVVFDEKAGGRVFERTATGEEEDWADVLAWDPPNGFTLLWRVNPERGATEVEVRFTPQGEGTRVDLEHRGWDAIGDAEGRTGYDNGWDFVLRRYSEASTSE